MKTTLSTILILFLTFSAFGNDGVYLTRGSVIYPTQETRISLDKEILSFTVRDRVGYVDIQFQFTQFDPGIFVFLFEITFKPGLNQINHSYNFPASGNVSMDEFYNYILTTGSKWADGKIKDLTVNIDMGQNQYFYVNDIFGQTANWSIIGTGKVTDEKFDYIDNDSCRMVRTLSGQVQIKVTDFKPTKNIEFGVVSRYSFISYSVDYEKIRKGEIVSIGNLFLEADYSKEELRLLRNTIYAQYGYDFNSPDLKEYFSQFAWYMPNPNLTMEDIILTEKEKEFVDKILMKEK
tara:strand:+ start:309 stop:1184 length:876 start_codon:yes stop_codon:yes gene_type:complete